ncbi:Presequence translocated-associated motor subunit PAM17, mitochondrial [Hypsizygus marmoreus]|uniref:Presequence translocated-associated motor subunit PAM17 n=1 Tax=Hypsizygus marmoreus TaxID=39966 RepID=A0A369JNP8_HYPMA|nr:Presequence translocated-associated motor subunit PAM17, mitochondrial [Hypsizygus marmoreus]
MVGSCLARPLGIYSRCAGRPLPRKLVLSRPQSTSAKPKRPIAHEVPRLTWPEYLEIRGGKRKWQIAATIPCALLGFFGGAAYFGSLETDPTKPIMGIDPFFFYGICTVGCVGVGALVGPTIGSSLWRTRHRSQVALVDVMDREFYQRIAKNRVDATLQSPTHPVPDYYGEKIGSLHQYRQWLRDQAKYKRKALLPEE